MDEPKLVDRFYGQCYFRHVESRDVLGEDLVLDEHRHQVSAGKEFHQHVQERRVLERRVQLDHPRRICFGQDVSLGSNVRQLILLELQRSAGS
jgi:hypothetical protein